MLKQADEALWGPQYRSEMARQLDVHLRTVMHWDNGETAIPLRSIHCCIARVIGGPA
jgi:hypothetical protein